MPSAQHGWTAGVAARARRYWSAVLLAAGELPCCRCGVMVHPEDPWDVDHVTPLSQGGSIGRENQAVAHRRCNRRHGQALAVAAAAAQHAASKGIRPW